jgi:hypothetical protein
MHKNSLCKTAEVTSLSLPIRLVAENRSFLAIFMKLTVSLFYKISSYSLHDSMRKGGGLVHYIDISIGEWGSGDGCRHEVGFYQQPYTGKEAVSLSRCGTLKHAMEVQLST